MTLWEELRSASPTLWSQASIVIKIASAHHDHLIASGTRSHSLEVHGGIVGHDTRRIKLQIRLFSLLAELYDLHCLSAQHCDNFSCEDPGCLTC